jgi:hypothetical protein
MAGNHLGCVHLERMRILLRQRMHRDRLLRHMYRLVPNPESLYLQVSARTCRLTVQPASTPRATEAKSLTDRHGSRSRDCRLVTARLVLPCMSSSDA